LAVAPAAVASDMSEMSHVSCFSRRNAQVGGTSQLSYLAGLHSTDGDDASCTNSDFISQLPAHTFLFPTSLKGTSGRVDGRCLPALIPPSPSGGGVVVVDKTGSTTTITAQDTPNTARLRVKLPATRTPIPSHPDPLTVGCCSLHAQARVALHQRPDGLDD